MKMGGSRVSILSSQNLWGSEFDSNKFELKAPFSMTGDQPKAVDSIVQGIGKNYSSQTLKGVTGSGKTFTMANIIENINTSEPWNKKPTTFIETKMLGNATRTHHLLDVCGPTLPPVYITYAQ